MRSSSPTNKSADAETKGTLYVLATPIGNLRDITFRAMDVLSSVDFIAAEDTRHTARLLKGCRSKGRLISYHEYNEEKRTPLLLEKLDAGFSVALVSNAGTPSISDPGFRLVEGAVAHNIPVSPVPGVSAAITALSVSGLPTDSFTFIGFLPRKKGRRIEQLQSLRDTPRTMVFYESPKRITQLLHDLLTVVGDRAAVLGREMTKRHEEFLRGRLSELLMVLKGRRDLKGEFTIVVSGHRSGTAMVTDSLYETLTTRLKKRNVLVSELVREVVRETGLSRKVVYGAALRIKRQLNHEAKIDGST